MSLQSFRMLCVVSFALLGVSFAVEHAAAQQGWPLNPVDRGGASSRSYRVVNSTILPSAREIIAPTAVSSEIQVQVPAGAKVWFNEKPTAQTGAARAFVSSPLTPGFEYSYAVRVSWRDGDRTIERKRTISFKAGERVNLDFTQSDLAASR